MQLHFQQHEIVFGLLIGIGRQIRHPALMRLRIFAATAARRAAENTAATTELREACRFPTASTNPIVMTHNQTILVIFNTFTVISLG